MKKKRLIVATKNQGKLREIRELLDGLPLEMCSLSDFQGLPEIVEDGSTFRANALKKALTIARHTGGLVLGEDSGIEVAALDKRPGVYSARYAGVQATDRKNNLKLLRELRGVPMKDRRARYRCVAALVEGETVIAVVSGRCEGMIAQQPQGRNGFGYDPLFFVPRHGQTFGMLDPSIKAVISHRARAMVRVRAALESYLAGACS